MLYLTKEYWKNFKRDGKLFEKLSKTLIEYEYNSKDFVIMGGPGDEGADITKTIKLLDNVKTEIWAQCKFHKKSLSFDDISFTLLMAYIRNSNQILVFSYSKVTNNFLNLLDEYRLRTGKSVIVYSDEELEKLIFKHKETLEKEHKEYFDEFPQFSEESKSVITYNYQLYVNGNKIDNKNAIINLNSLCEIVVTLTNKSNKKQCVNIETIKSKVSNNFVFLQRELNTNFDIKAFESRTFNFYVKLRKFVKKTSLPSFYLKYGNEQIKITSNLKLSCRWLADTVLIGDKYYKAIDRIDTGVKAPHFHLSIVYGKSGVDKSRIMKEILDKGVVCNKRTISIDSDKKIFSCKFFMELVCSQITQLPFFNQKIDFLLDGCDDTISFASKILYEQNFDFTNEWEKCANFLITALTENSFILVLDNLQHFDKLSLQIIEKTINCLSQTSSTTSIIFGINTDYIYKNSYFDEVFFRLKCLVANNSQLYSLIELEGFEENDAELYIRECLSYRPEDECFSVIQYNQTIKKMVKHCDYNPFYIQQYLLYLEQEDIIRFSEHTLYYFHDVRKFLESFEKIPTEIKALIELREQTLVKKLNDESYQKYKELIYLLNITKSLPKDLYYEIINDKDLLVILFNLGFISISNNNITTVHSFYSLYYNSKYDTDSIPIELLKNFNKAIEKMKYKQRFALPFYWAKYRIGDIDTNDIKNIAINLATGHYDCISNYFCFNSLCRTINYNFKEIGLNLYVGAYDCLCGKVDETIGIKGSIMIYSLFTDVFTENIFPFTDILDKTIHLVTSYLIHLINLEEYDKCLETINIILEKTNSLSYVDITKIKYHMNRCKIMIYNRNNSVNDAIKAAEECLAILDDPKIPVGFKNRYIYSAKRSIGNTFFYSTIANEKREEIALHWNDSFNTYVKNNGFNIFEEYSNQPKIAAVAKGLAADMITGEESIGDQKMKYFINAFDHMNMMYYEMQIRLLVAMYIIWKWSNGPYYINKLEEIIKYIDQSLDIAAIYGRELTTINAFHLKGVAYFLNGNYLLAADNYCIAADMLSKYLSTDKDFERWNYFWIDMARVLKKSGQKSFLSRIRLTEKTLNRIERIIKLDDDKFSKFENDYVPLTALTDKNFSIGFPKI